MYIKAIRWSLTVPGHWKNRNRVPFGNGT